MPNDVINTITIGGTTYDIGGSGGGSGRAINATLLANGWDTNKRQALQFIGYNVNQNGVIGMPTSVTSTQKTAYQDADIRIYSQSSDTFTFECGATVPTIDLPVTLFVTDASSTAAFVYKPAGSKTVAELISSLLVEANLGNVYNMTDSGTTTADFVEGAGKPIYAGDDVGIIDNGTSGSPSYKFNKLGGFIDLSNYIQKSQTAGLVKNDGTIDETEYQPAQEGKGLSTNDYDNTDKAKVDKIDETTQSATGNPISISGLKSNQLAIDPIITFEPIETGTGTKSPSNPWTISGYDKVEVESCGNNLFDSDQILQASGWSKSNGVYSGYLSDIIVKFGSGFNTPKFKANTQYTISYYGWLADVSTNRNFRFVFNYTDGTSSQVAYNNYTTKTYITGTSTSGKTVASIGCNYGSSTTMYLQDIQLEEGASATAYVPFNPLTKISESLGQTVYGATWYPRTGELTVTKMLVDLGSLTWYRYSTTSIFHATPTGQKVISSVVCDSYNGVNSKIVNLQDKEISASAEGFSTGCKIAIRDDNYTDANTFAATLVGKYAVTELETPFTIQLTPHEISLLKDYAYVSTNGTNIALDYHNGELASLADVSQLGETVNELGEYVGANNLGSQNAIVIPETGNFICPSDGYVVVRSGNNASDFYRVDVYGNQKVSTNRIIIKVNSTPDTASKYQYFSVYVRKGMIVTFGEKSSGNTTGGANFVTIE